MLFLTLMSSENALRPPSWFTVSRRYGTENKAISLVSACVRAYACVHSRPQSLRLRQVALRTRMACVVGVAARYAYACACRNQIRN